MTEFILKSSHPSTQPVRPRAHGRVVRAGQSTASQIDYAKELNPEQLAVVTGAEGPCLVLAGAGSGKTRTIVYRVAYLLEQGVEPEEIMLVTFTNKATREMLKRVEELLGFWPASTTRKRGEPEGLVGGTFHHLANRFLRKYAKLLGRENNFTILDEDDAQSLLKKIIKEEHFAATGERFPSPAVISNIISYSVNAQKDLAEVIFDKHPQWGKFLGPIGEIAKIYQTKKQAGNLMDFDDLLYYWWRLLVEHEQARAHLSGQFRYILVDEYQDVNVIQASIVQLLAKTHGNVLVVGDDAQSIYSFRAADISHILNFPRAYPQAKIYKIETNYRSTQPILQLANEVIAHNVEQFKKTLISPKKSDILPKLVPARTGRQEAQFIVQMILKLTQTGEKKLSDIAVLFRAAFHSQMVELELAKANIPYDYRGGTRFFARAHIKDVLAFLKIVHNIHDEVAWSRILSLQPGIGPATIKGLWEEIQQSPDLPAVLARPSYSLGAKAGTSWRNLAKFLNQLVELNSLLPAELMNKVLASDYRDYLEVEYPDFKDRLQDLEGLVEFAQTYDTLEKFLAEVTLEEMFSMKANQEAVRETDRLVLSTIHQAKGLEWPTVFVLHLTEAHFPNPRALKEENGLEEERRLFYVAITRAADLLFLTYPQTSIDFNLWYQPSPFLQEVDFDLFEEIQLVTDSPGFKQNLSDDTAAFLRDDTEKVISLDGGAQNKPKRPTSFLPEIEEL